MAIEIGEDLQMELWDVYNRDRIKKDKFIVRGEAFEEGDYHLVVHVCIFNSAGEMLIQQRQPFKIGWPDKWDITVGGSAIKGDSSQVAAERELEEELGIYLNLEELRPHFTINFERGFDDIYLVEKEINLEDVKLQEEEVKDVKWATREEIIEMIRSGEFIPYYEGMIHLLFEMRGKYGCIRQ